MPVVAHQAVGEQVHLKSLQRLGQRLQEGGEVGFAAEEHSPAIAVVKDMVTVRASIILGLRDMREKVIKTTKSVQKQDEPVFSRGCNGRWIQHR